MRYPALILPVIFVASGLHPALAQTFMQRLACTGDAMRLCRAYVPNHQLVANCMEMKHDQLSPRCMAVFDSGMQNLRAQGRRVP